MPELHLIVRESIADVPRGAWESLTATDVHGQYGWLHSLEAGADGAKEPLYFLLYRDDELVAAAAGYRYCRDGRPNRPGELLFGKAFRLATAMHLVPKKILYIGPLFGHGRYIFWDRKYDEHEAIRHIQDLVGAILSCKEIGDRATLVFGRIPSDEVELLAALRQLGCLDTRSWPISYIDLPWNDFEDYVSSLARRGKNMPTKVRHEVSAPAKHAVRIEEVGDFSSCASEIYGLFEDTYRKYAGFRPDFSPRLVEALAARHRQGCVMSVASTDHAVPKLGAALLLTANGNAAGSLIGMADEEVNRKAFTYFHLAFYAPIRHCITRGIRRIYLGGGHREAKQKRGCKEMDVHLFLRPAGLVASVFWHLWLLFHRYRVQRKSARQSI